MPWDGLHSLLSGIPADMCKVTTLIFRQDDQSGVTPNRLLSDLERLMLKFSRRPFIRSPSGKHFDTARSETLLS